MSKKLQNRVTFKSILCVSVLAALLTGGAVASDVWTDKQTKAHEIAQLARSLELPEDNPIIIEAKRLWYEDYSVKTDTYVPLYSDEDAIILAKIMYSEARGIESDTELACLAWAVLNRVDAGYGKTIAEVATAPGQFGYRASAQVWDRLLTLSYDVLDRWQREKNGETAVGRVLPTDYMWYYGDGMHNHFRNAYNGGSSWNYALASPYSS